MLLGQKLNAVSSPLKTQYRAVLEAKAAEIARLMEEIYAAFQEADRADRAGDAARAAEALTRWGRLIEQHRAGEVAFAELNTRLVREECRLYQEAQPQTRSAATEGT